MKTRLINGRRGMNFQR